MAVTAHWLPPSLSCVDRPTRNSRPVIQHRDQQAPAGTERLSTDYVSMAPYFWPDPAKKDDSPLHLTGLAESGPECEKFDAP